MLWYDLAEEKQMCVSQLKDIMSRSEFEMWILRGSIKPFAWRAKELDVARISKTDFKDWFVDLKSQVDCERESLKYLNQLEEDMKNA